MDPLVNGLDEGQDTYAYRRYGRPVSAPDSTGLDIHISISYKTLLIVFALFSIASRTFDMALDYINP